MPDGMQSRESGSKPTAEQIAGHHLREMYRSLIDDDIRSGRTLPCDVDDIKNRFERMLPDIIAGRTDWDALFVS